MGDDVAPTSPKYKGLRPSSARASAAARGASKKRNTRCELALRSALWRLGLRYRVVVDTLPGKPDIVFGPPRDRRRRGMKAHTKTLRGIRGYPSTQCVGHGAVMCMFDLAIAKLEGKE